MNGITPEFRQGQRNRETTQYPHHGGYVRNQRQFGTSVGVSLDSGVMDEPRTSAATSYSQHQSSTERYLANNTEDGLSDVSSTSSDEDILSFNIFGKK